MENKQYVSKTGESRSYNGWKQWATSFYHNLQEEGFNTLPSNWFERAQRVLKLEEAAS